MFRAIQLVFCTLYSLQCTVGLLQYTLLQQKGHKSKESTCHQCASSCLWAGSGQSTSSTSQAIFSLLRQREKKPLISSDISTICLPLPLCPPLPLSCPLPPSRPPRIRSRPRPLTLFLLSILRLSPSHLQQPVCSLNWLILVVSHHLIQVKSILSGCV